MAFSCCVKNARAYLDAPTPSAEAAGKCVGEKVVVAFFTSCIFKADRFSLGIARRPCGSGQPVTAVSSPLI
jgi:hypothetical protein